MEYFYSENLSTREKQIILSVEESRHLRKVLRKRQGDTIQITDGKGLLANAIIFGEKSKSLLCDVQSIRSMPPPTERRIHIGLSTIRSNRLDWAVEKLTELGVGTISFFYSAFTGVKSFKADHLRRIAISAIKQSKQTYLPKINPPLPFSEWIRSLNQADNQICLLAHLKDGVPKISQLPLETIHPKNQSMIVAAIGPEGGFSEQELTAACEKGFQLVSLDNHILRTETAAVVAAAHAKLLIGRINESP